MKKKEKIIQICYVCKKEFTHKRNSIVKCCGDKCREIYKTLPEIKIKTYNNTKISLMNKYGVDHPSKINGFKEKIKNTKLKRYGNENYVNVDKCKMTKLKKYGNDKYNNRSSIQKKEFLNIIQKLEINNISLLEKIQTLRFKKNNVIHDKKFKMKCLSCNTKFKSHLSNGHLPICPTCYPSGKIGDKVKSEILLFLKSNYDKFIDVNNRTILSNNKELDFYLPDLNFAIEYDGIIWHSEQYGNKNKHYHLNKTLECQQKNIYLIHIFENEWVHKKSIIKSIILNKLKKNKIHYARNTEIQLVSNTDKESFLIQNHLQGNSNSSINIGLYYKNELIQIMTFSKSRFNNKYEYELTRFCNKINYSVIGGANKLFNYFIKTYSPKSIISYSDMRYFTGKFYTSLKFNYIGTSSPNYFYFKYTDQLNLINRLKFQKHKLKNILKNFDESISESQNMFNNKYDRIWDCGNKKYEYIA